MVCIGSEIGRPAFRIVEGLEGRRNGSRHPDRLESERAVPVPCDGSVDRRPAATLGDATIEVFAEPTHASSWQSPGLHP